MRYLLGYYYYYYCHYYYYYASSSSYYYYYLYSYSSSSSYYYYCPRTRFYSGACLLLAMYAMNSDSWRRSGAGRDPVDHAPCLSIL